MTPDIDHDWYAKYRREVEAAWQVRDSFESAYRRAVRMAHEKRPAASPICYLVVISEKPEAP